MERCATKMQILADSIRTASYGYAPLFDDVRVKEEELDALAQFDEGLAAGVERIKTIIDTMGTLAGRPEQDWMEFDPRPEQHCREPEHRVRPSPRGDPTGRTCGR